MSRTTVLTAALLATTLLAAAAESAAPAAAAPAAPHTRTVHRTSPHLMGLHRRRAGAAQQSLNWSGYVRAGSGFTSATGSWTVPALANGQDGYSSTWVGIDGATSGDGYLIQTGTEADSVGGRVSYRAWWEVITPSNVAPETLFDTLAVHPGDAISASVSRTASGRWTMKLVNGTTGHSASHTSAFAGTGASAEWIQEDTDVDGSISTAPNWGAVAFRRLTLNGANPRLQAREAVDIVDRHGVRETSTSAPVASGAGFTVTWLAAGSATAAG